jgi:hypothetical protein
VALGQMAKIGVDKSNPTELVLIVDGSTDSRKKGLGHIGSERFIEMIYCTVHVGVSKQRVTVKKDKKE